MTVFGFSAQAATLRAVLLATSLTTVFAPINASAATTFKIIHDFRGGRGGAGPTQLSSLQSDVKDPATWALYGTTSYAGSIASQYCGDAGGCGTVFKLAPPAAGAKVWRATTLYAFTGAPDGATPSAGLVADASGALYGTTSFGGYTNNFGNGGGTVFRLQLGPTGHWSETVLHRFTGVDGKEPVANVILGAGGTFFGTTFQGGTTNEGIVFQLQPPAPGAAKWTERVIADFSGGIIDGAFPEAPVLLLASGALVGTAKLGGGWEAGTAFMLTPPAAGSLVWTRSLLTSFNGPDGFSPEAGLIADPAGTLYGTTAGGGEYGFGGVFALSPPAAGVTTWTQTVLFSFTKGTDGGTPESALYRDAAGALYGVTDFGGDLDCGHGAGCGAVFKLAPPAKGQAAWKETVLHAFHGGTDAFPDGVGAASALVGGPDGAIYGATAYGGTGNAGVVFRITQ